MEVFGEHRLLDEEQVERLERRTHAACHRLRPVAVHVDSNVAVGTDRFAKRGEAIDDRVPVRRHVDGVGLRGVSLNAVNPRSTQGVVSATISSGEKSQRSSPAAVLVALVGFFGSLCASILKGSPWSFVRRVRTGPAARPQLPLALSDRGGRAAEGDPHQPHRGRHARHRRRTARRLETVATSPRRA